MLGIFIKIFARWPNVEIYPPYIDKVRWIPLGKDDKSSLASNVRYSPSLGKKRQQTVKQPNSIRQKIPVLTCDSEDTHSSCATLQVDL